MLIKDAMDVKVPPEDIEGYMLQLDGNVVVDLGDDAYTQGKPHPRSSCKAYRVYAGSCR